MKIFKEEQRFNQLWLIILILISILVVIGIVLGTYIKDSNSFSTLELLLTIGGTILASSIIFFFRLSTRIDEKGIHYKFFPFHWNYKVIKWGEITNAYVRTYDALSEYGGWGLKGGLLWKKSKGKAMNVSGDVGIQLELKHGKKLLIGTQKQKQAESVLATYKAKLNKQDNG